MIRRLSLRIRLWCADGVREGGAWIAEVIAPELGSSPRPRLRIPPPPHWLRVSAALPIMAAGAALDVVVALLDAAAAALLPATDRSRKDPE